MITLMQNNGQFSLDAEAARRAVCFGHIEDWNNDYLDFYSEVATIATDDLEESFEIHNRSRAFGYGDHFDYDERIQTIKQHYSMSVGDIVRDEEGNHHMVCKLGFAQI